MKDFHQLKVWQKAHQLTLRNLSHECGIPIAANLAEGCGRNGDAELAEVEKSTQRSALSFQL